MYNTIIHAKKNGESYVYREESKVAGLKKKNGCAPLQNQANQFETNYRQIVERMTWKTSRWIYM